MVNLKDLTFKALVNLWEADNNKINKINEIKSKLLKPLEPKDNIKNFNQYLDEDNRYLKDPGKFRSYWYKNHPYNPAWIFFSSILLIIIASLTIVFYHVNFVPFIISCILIPFSILFLLYTINKRLKYLKNIEKEREENEKLKKESELWYVQVKKDYEDYLKIFAINYDNAIKKYKNDLAQYNEKISKLDKDRSILNLEIINIKETIFTKCINIMKKDSKFFIKNHIEYVKSIKVDWANIFSYYVKNHTDTRYDSKILKDYFIDQARIQADIEERKEMERIAREEAEEQRKIRNVELKNSITEYQMQINIEKKKENYENKLEEERKEREIKMKIKEQANAQAATIRCAQCHLYRTCCSYKKNKDPNCTAFRYRENFK